MARTILRSVAGWLFFACLLLPLGAEASTSRAAKGVTTYGEIEAIAMDGPLVAYDVGARENVGARCNKLYVWNVRTGARKKVSGKGTCDADSTSTGLGVAEIAVAGKRIAWIVNEGGNTESTDDLYASSWRKPKERKLASAQRVGDVAAAVTGRWIGGLVGSGKLLVVNRWSTDDTGDVVNAKLERIGRRLTKIASGTGTIVARSAESGRIAVVRSGGDLVLLYSKTGALLRVFAPGPFRDIALGKRSLVALTMANKLEVYNTSTGKLTHTWPVKGHWSKPGRVGSGSRLDVQRGIAVYSNYHTVYAIRLATGKNALIVKSKKGRRIEERLEIEAPGVAYAFDTFNRKTLKTHGHVAFIPMRKVRAAVS